MILEMTSDHDLWSNLRNYLRNHLRNCTYKLSYKRAILVRLPAHWTTQIHLKFFSQLILMYLSALMRNPNNAELHLVSIFVQIHLTVTNREFTYYGYCSTFCGISWVSVAILLLQKMLTGLSSASSGFLILSPWWSQNNWEKTLDAFATLAKNQGLAAQLSCLIIIIVLTSVLLYYRERAGEMYCRVSG